MSSDVQKAWSNLEEALKRQAPNYLSALGNGGTTAEIALVESTIGQSLPDEIKAFHLRHSGENRLDKTPPLLKFHLLHSLDRIITEWKFNLDCEGRAKGRQVSRYEGPVKKLVRHSKWIPLATDINGDGLYFDLDPDQGGVVGQIIDVSYRRSVIQVLAPSISHLLEQRAAELNKASRPKATARKNGKVTQAWEKFRDSLKTNAPKSLAALRPPVEMADLEYFQLKSGLKLPQDVKDFFLGHNGETPIDEMAGPLFEFGYLIPLIATSPEECVLEEWERIAEIAVDDEELGDPDQEPEGEYEGPVHRVLYSRKWVPFAIDYSGNALCFDLDPARGGKAGQVIECDYDMQTIKIIANSVSEFLINRAAVIHQSGSEIFDERDLLKTTLRIENLPELKPGTILSNETLKILNLELKVLPASVLEQAFKDFEEQSLREEKKDISVDSRKTIAFTIYRASEPGTESLPGDFTIAGQVLKGEEILSHGLGLIHARSGEYRSRPIYSSVTLNPIPSNSVLVIEIQGPRPV